MNIILLQLIFLGLRVVDSAEPCWWTGCQSNSWAVRGCDHYDRVQSDIRACADGSEYFCCEKPVTPTTPKPGCWWTGCQSNSWAVRGCDQYDRVQGDIRACADGSEYLCCEKPVTPTTPKPGCWWTGCQSNSWAVVGCQQYNLSQSDSRSCKDGQEYYCCPGSSVPKDDVELECWWSGCQPRNWTQRGCPADTKQKGTQPCGDDGDIYECCWAPQPEKEEEEIELVSGDSFVNFVKYLLLKGKNFTTEPDNLPCLAVDVDKQTIFQIKNQGIYTCDLCPYFPHKRFVNVFLSNLPADIIPNVVFPECFGLCFDRDDCVAYSYDHLEHTCYIYNNTVGTFIEEEKWTTVIMTQPVGVVEKWTYSRHTSITGLILQSTIANSFLLCLTKCDAISGCNYVSYSFATSNCTMFSSQDTIKYIDLNYAHISGFKISSMPVESDAISRFTEEGDDLFETTNTNALTNKECSSFKNATHSAFYSQSCLTSGSLGCDVTTGCKMCYYPEKTNAYNNLAICPDSDWITVSELKQSIQKFSGSCLEDPSCVGVGYNSTTKEIHRLTFNNFAQDAYTTKFILKYPIRNSGDQVLMTKYDFLFNHDIERFASDSGFQEITGTLRQCLDLYGSNDNYTRMSYSNDKCKISSEEVKYVFKRGNFATVFKKPGLLTDLINFARTPGFVIPKGFAERVYQCGGNCDEICSRKCNQEFKSWCSHFSKERNVNNSVCYFFRVIAGSVEDGTNLQRIKEGQLFTKLSSANFTLESLNSLNAFQASDIYNCFQPETVRQQSQTSLTTLETTDSQDVVGLRRKRYGIVFQHDEAVAMFGVIKETVQETVQDTVDNVVDTATGLAGSIEHAVNGDLDRAEEAFLTIPIVKDVKGVVELNEAVFTGDWEKAEEKGIELLQSSVLDMAASAIPVVGKGVGRGLKVVGKTLKKQVSRVKKTAKKNIDALTDRNKKIDSKKNDRDGNNENDNNKDVDNNDYERNNKDRNNDDKNNDNDKDVDNNDNEHNNKDRNNDDKNNDKDSERNHCKQRTKRATNKRGRANPEDCEEEEENEICPRVGIIPEAMSMAKCKNRRPNAECEFVCNPGYDEPDESVKCVRVGNQKPHWSTEPECKRIACGDSNYPMIPLRSPHVKALGNLEFGNFVTAYIVLFDKKRKIPAWSLALHQSNQFFSRDYTALKQFGRKSTFKQFPCTELHNHQADDSDYAFSGWDRGHLTPANVERWSEKAVISSNLYINVAPQDPFTNRHPWAILEKQVEKFTKDHRSLVVTGLCSRSLGKLKNRVDIPACFYKMICYRDDEDNHQVVGFIAENTKVSTAQEKNARARQVYTPVSQKEIQGLIDLDNMHVNSAWMNSAAVINRGRPIRIGLDVVWMVINPILCVNKYTLSEREAQFWRDFLPTVVENDRRKRTVDEQEYTNKSESENYSNDSDEINDDVSSLEESVLVNVQSCNKRIIGYYTSTGDKEISGDELKRLTHVIYAFLEVGADGSIDYIQNTTHTNKLLKARKRLENLMQTASSYPHVKVMFAVGGWENSQYFSAVAASPEKRITFIAAIVKLIQRYGFNGVDINWQYPVTGGADEGTPQDRRNYVLLMKEIRTALDSLAEVDGRGRFLLSFAGATEKWTVDRGFDLAGLLRYADFVNVMTYDYFGAWAGKWGAYTGRPLNSVFSETRNTDWTVKYYTCRSKLPHKINMGVPFYGRYWEHLGAPVDGNDGMWRTATKVNGIFKGGYVPYYKIQSEHLSNVSQQGTFLGYENKESLQLKVDYAVKKNLGGIVIFAVDMDDDNFSLLDTVASASLCHKTDPREINHMCSTDEKIVSSVVF